MTVPSFHGNCRIFDSAFVLKSPQVPADTANNPNPYLFTGRRIDILDSGSLKLQYYRNRYYDTYTGRFLTKDPLGVTPHAPAPNTFAPLSQYNDGANLYQYVKSNPVIGMDVYGLKGCRGYAVGLCSRNVANKTVPDPLYLYVPLMTKPINIAPLANALIPDHHDVRVQEFAKADCTGPVISEDTKGFQADSFTEALIEPIKDLFLLSSTYGWVGGHVENAASPGTCSMNCVSKDTYDRVKGRLDSLRPTRYHTLRYNCQHWASDVLD